LERSWSGAGAGLERSRQNPGVGAVDGKWPALEPESELKSFENLAPEQEPEPLKFSRLHQP